MYNTFIEAIFIRGPINIEILPSPKGELCLGVLIGSVIRIITVKSETNIQPILNNMHVQNMIYLF